MPLSEEYAGKRVTIMGLGSFGGGLGAVRFFLDRGAIVTLTDLRSASQLQSSLDQFNTDQLHALILEQHREEDFVGADLIVVNPAVNPLRNRFLEAAKSHGVELTSEIELFWQHCPAKKIVVTGTVGKSTTTTLIHHVLQHAGESVRLGGNLGVSLLPIVDEIARDEWIVLELSSFQLAALNKIQCAPDITVVTNFAPNHLDWHGDVEHYRDSKQAALRWQSPDQFAVLNADCPNSSEWSTKAKPFFFGTNLRSTASVQIHSQHFLITSPEEQIVNFDSLSPCLCFSYQYQNVAAALTVLSVIRKLPPKVIRDALATYVGLPHRFELIPTNCGRKIINDSKATTPEATIAALQSLVGPVVLIAGGKDKQIDLTALCHQIATRTKAVALLGDTALSMSQIILACHPNLPLEVFSKFPEALDWASAETLTDETLLLSPGCASHPPFRNYEDRGEQFRDFFSS